MSKAMTTSRDPVCGMNIEIAQSPFSVSYRGMRYHFCSAHCLERFNDIPALYTGSQLIADIRLIPKRRILRLIEGSSSAPLRACQRLGKMIGVSKVVADKRGLLVEYDLRQTILSQIEAVAIAEGLRLQGGFHGFRRSLWKYLEAGELENAAHPSSGACCNRPPVKFR